MTQTVERREPGTAAWIGPFVVFLVWHAVDSYLPLANPAKELLRDAVLLASILGFSRQLLPTRAPHWVASIAIGLGVFVLWVAPDVLLAGWRDSSVFQNSITGRIRTSIDPTEFTPLMLALRTVRASLLVPVLEELFWRGWLPRWVQDTHIANVPVGEGFATRGDRTVTGGSLTVF